MALPKSEGVLLSNDQLLGGLLQNSEFNLGLICRLPMRPVFGHSLRMARSSAFGFGPFPSFMKGLNPEPVGPEGTAFPDDQPSYDHASVTQNVGFNEFTLFTQSEIIDNAQDQYCAACVRISCILEDACINGNAFLNPGQFNGLETLIPMSQSILPNDTVNNYLSLMDLARLVSLVRVSSDHILLTSRRGFNEIREAYNQAGVDPSPILELPGLPFAQLTGCDCDYGPNLAFHGFPVVISDKVRDDHTIGSFGDATKIYAITLGEDGFYGITPPEGFQFGVRDVLDTSITEVRYRVYTSLSVALARDDAVASLTIRPRPSTD